MISAFISRGAAFFVVPSAASPAGRRDPRRHAALPADEINRPTARSSSMLDLILLAIGVAFFALSIAYVAACDRL
jgi:hypothetical protein